MDSKKTAKDKKAEKKARRAAKVSQKDDKENIDSSASQPADDAGAGQAATGAVAAAKLQGDVQPQPGTIQQQTEPPQPRTLQQQTETPQPRKKQLSKAERRELQEAQRQAKVEKSRPVETPKQAQPSSSKPTQEPKEKIKKEIKSKSRLELLPNLRVNYGVFEKLDRTGVHPITLKVGIQMSDGKLTGSNSRAVGLLVMLQHLIRDYQQPADREFSRDFMSYLKINLDFLSRCRPLSVSMMSIVKCLQSLLHNRELPDTQSKNMLCEDLQNFYNERINLHEISVRAAQKICNNDVIITYAHSSVVLEVLCEAYRQDLKFSVIVVDSRVKPEGKEMLRKLIKRCPNLSCSYAHINALSYVMSKTSRVLLGAHSVLANGYIMSRVGTSQVALVATSFNVPVLVCCETYKFSERTQTDSLVNNELGNPSSLAVTADNLSVYNLTYDVTPPQYVNGIITETAIIPCTSAPVVYRVKQQYDIVDNK